jgi:NAD(P)-dependent dehydrogenase (short-subunit alcohol dehydrogenase family)
MTTMRAIEIDLAEQRFGFLGQAGQLRDALVAALTENGGVPAVAADAGLVIALYPLLPSPRPVPDLLDALRREGDRLAAGNGRIVMVLSALAGLPMRRHTHYSAEMAKAWAGMRTLAMSLAPNVLVNAVGAGFIDEATTPLAGDPLMPGHAGLSRPGRLADLVNAVLFLADPANTYTTGQLLNVDGGWTVGYGRNF